MASFATVETVSCDLASLVLAHIVTAIDRYGLTHVRPLHDDQTLRFRVGDGAFSATIPILTEEAETAVRDRRLSDLVEERVARAVQPFRVLLARAA